MSRMLRQPDRLAFSDKVMRLGQRLKDPEWRRYGLTLLAGKMIALAILGLVIVSIVAYIHSTTAYGVEPATGPATTLPALPGVVDAATQPATQATTQAAAVDPVAAAYAAAKGGDIINPLNTVWTLVAAFLVFGMQVGFTMLEAGFCRSRETVNVLVECVFDTCFAACCTSRLAMRLCSVHGNGFIGWHDPTNADQSWFFLKGVNANSLYGATGVPVLAHWLFQFAFADCASTICSGTMIGRTAFWGDILYSVCVSGFIYPILGHWAGVRMDFWQPWARPIRLMEAITTSLRASA